MGMNFYEVRTDPELQRREELRRNALVPIYMMWTSDIPNHASQAAVEGVTQAMAASGQNRDLVILGTTQWSEGEYSSADWYLRQTLATETTFRDQGHGRQVNVSNLGSLFYKEP